MVAVVIVNVAGRVVRNSIIMPVGVEPSPRRPVVGFHVIAIVRVHGWRVVDWSRTIIVATDIVLSTLTMPVTSTCRENLPRQG